MSRTFRRRGYEKIHNVGLPGGKIAGYYTIESHNWYPYYYDRDDYVEFEDRYRAPTNQEYNKKFWKLHSDNHSNDWTPSRDYRYHRMVQNRAINKHEIIKWIKNNEYEPLTEPNPRSCQWDWD